MTSSGGGLEKAGIDMPGETPKLGRRWGIMIEIKYPPEKVLSRRFRQMDSLTKVDVKATYSRRDFIITEASRAHGYEFFLSSCD